MLITYRSSKSLLSRCAVTCAWVALASTTAFAQTPPPGGPPGAPAGMPSLPENPLMLKKVADAKPGDVRLMVTAAMMGPIEQVRAQAEKAIGRPLFIEYGSARGNLKDEIVNGQAFEVAILLPDVNAELLQKGKIARGEHQITNVKAAIAIRGDANVDVSTPDGLKKTLLGAAVVRYSPTGVAYPTVKKLLSDLGIADSIKDASKSGTPPVPPGAQSLPPGQYEINLFPLSEIVRIKGVKNLGLVIAPFQVPQDITAVIGANANDRKAAEALVKFLESSALDAPLKEAGMARDKTT